jgi:hypothetical protein
LIYIFAQAFYAPRYAAGNKFSHYFWPAAAAAPVRRAAFWSSARNFLGFAAAIAFLSYASGYFFTFAAELETKVAIYVLGYITCQYEFYIFILLQNNSINK